MPRTNTLQAMRRRLRSRPRAARPIPHGAATLVVVMVLFFIVALVAAYTSRNLIFEQRTAANQYGATQAFEAAEAGLEWALGMLNGGRITNQCTADSATVADPTFRQRYLGVSDVDGSITVLSPGGQTLTPGCVLDATDGAPRWRCECPLNTAPALVAPAGTAVAPAFRVRFVIPDPALRPDLVRIESNGCTRLDDACLNFPSQAVAGSGRATVSVLATLKSALTMPPHAALTLGGSIDLGGAALTAVNISLAGPNITVRAGHEIAEAGLVLIGRPGMPGPDTLFRHDEALRPQELVLDLVPLTTGDRVFVSHFGLTPNLYRDQPAAVLLDCGEPPAACAGETLRSLVALNPGRVIWAEGDIDIDSDGDIGAAATPVMLVLTGNLTFSAANAILHGAVYSRSEDWITAGTGRINGAAIAQGDVSGSGTPLIVFDRDILTRLRLTHGSFVRLPGSWKDFP